MSKLRSLRPSRVRSHAGLIAALLILPAASASAATTTVQVSSLTVVLGKATGTVSGFAPSTQVTIDGQSYTAGATGSVTLTAAQLNYDSQLSIAFTDSDGDDQATSVTLRDLVDGSTLTAAELFDAIPDLTQSASTSVGQAAPAGSGEPDGSGGANAGATSGSTGAQPANPTSVVTSATHPHGAVQLPGGVISIPVTSVTSPHRLVIAAVSFNPALVNSRTRPIIARITVADTRGYRVRNALVTLRGIPERRINKVVERRTTSDGTVTFNLKPTKLLPLKKGARLTVLVRARATTVNTHITRRLVSVRLTKPR
jgi:hypothetical protein